MRLAAHCGKSISQMVAEYFSRLGEVDPGQWEMTPRVRSLCGAPAGATISIGDVRRYQEEKHK